MAAMIGFGLSWAMRRVDAVLRRRLGIVEFSDDPECVFRISRRVLPAAVVLPSGASVAAGQAIIDVHLWNERLPAIPTEGSTTAWAVAFGRRLQYSFGLLADYIVRDPQRRDIVAIAAEPVFPARLGPDALTRLCRRLGWEILPPEKRGRLAVWLDNVLIWLLILVFNREGSRGRGLSHGRIEVWMTRARLLDRYAARTDIGNDGKVMVKQS